MPQSTPGTDPSGLTLDNAEANRSDGFAAELSAAIAQRFHRDAGSVLWIHVVGALALAVLLGEQMGLVVSASLVGIIAAGSALRVVLHRRIAGSWDSAESRIRQIRWSTAFQAAAWGAGAFLVVPALPAGAEGHFLMLCVGLVAGAVATHKVDAWGFNIFVALVLVPTMTALLLHSGPFVVLDLVLVVLFWVVMGTLQRRLQAHLTHGFEANIQLQDAAAKAIREQTFLDAILAGSPMAVVVMDPDGQVDRQSSEFIRLMALTAGDSGHATLTERHPVWSDLQRTAQEARKQGRCLVDVIIGTGSDAVALQISAASASGAATGWVTCILEDLTHIRQAEQARARAEQSYQELVQSAHDLIWQTDARANWTFLNAAAGEIYGVSPVDLLGQSCMDRVAPERAATDMHAFEKVLTGDDLVNHETVHIAEDGSRRVLSFSARPLLGEDGEIVGAQGVARDVTERWEAEEQARQLAREAYLATQMKSAFLANMSHEIRTPMNGVLGMTELLLGTELNDEQRQYLEIIQNSGSNLLRILNDILDFSKIEAGHMELESIQFDPVQSVGDSVRVLQSVAAKKGSELVLDLDPSLPHLTRGDPGRLSQVITNLVSNAVKFTENGTVTVKASLSSEKDAFAGTVHKMLVSVKDTGVGIPEEKLDTIFGEFSQADASVTRKFGGTGLGLAICRKLVVLMGGDLHVRSTLGEGSEFYFDLPLVEPDFEAKGETPELDDAHVVAVPSTGSTAPSATNAAAPPRGAPASGAPGAGAAAAGPRARLLLAEDTLVNQQVALAVLEKAGYEVTLVEDGQSAVDARWAEDFDLILMDIQMPILDGLEATRAIRQAEYGDVPHIPIVALTAHALAEERNRCMAAGMDDFLSKPFKAAELLTVVEKWALHGKSTLPPSHSDQARASAPEEVVEMETPTPAPKSASVETPAPTSAPVDTPATAEEEPFVIDPSFIVGGAHTAEETGESVEPSAAAGDTEADGDPGTADPAEGAPAGENPPILMDEFRAGLAEAGIESIADTMLELFVQELPERVGDIQSAFDAHDLPELGKAAHALKSAAGNIRADNLFEHLKALEAAAKAGDETESTTETTIVLEEAERARQFLEALPQP